MSKPDALPATCLARSRACSPKCLNIGPTNCVRAAVVAMVTRSAAIGGKVSPPSYEKVPSGGSGLHLIYNSLAGPGPLADLYTPPSQSLIWWPTRFFSENPDLIGWGFFVPLSPMSTPAALRRQANLYKRNGKIRDAFYRRYTCIPRAQKPDRGQVVAQLTAEHFLSVATLEKLLYAG